MGILLLFRFAILNTLALCYNLAVNRHIFGVNAGPVLVVVVDTPRDKNITGMLLIFGIVSCLPTYLFSC